MRSQLVSSIVLIAVVASGCSGDTAGDINSPPAAVNNAASIEVAIAPATSNFYAKARSFYREGESVAVTAKILDSQGKVVTDGAVAWEANGVAFVAIDSRSATFSAKAGYTTIRATTPRLGGGRIVQSASILIAPSTRTLVWNTDGSLTDVPLPDDAWLVRPKAINNRGEVVGTVGYPASGSTFVGSVSLVYRFFIWSISGGYREIPRDNAFAVDINDSGVVMGTIAGSPFLWTDQGGVELVRDVSPSFDVVAINKLGHIAGSKAESAVFLVPSVAVATYPLRPAYAQDINDRDDVLVGEGYSPFYYSDPTAFSIWNGLSVTRTDCVCRLSAMNNSRQVVGTTLVNGRYDQVFRWSAEQGFVRLPLSSVSAINDAGEVAGNGLADSASRPTVWSESGLRTMPLAGFTTHDLNNLGQVLVSAR
ncbi:MAG: hypothetical protein ABIS03_14330 [Gemmatimonadaceae bacterium]